MRHGGLWGADEEQKRDLIVAVCRQQQVWIWMPLIRDWGCSQIHQGRTVRAWVNGRISLNTGACFLDCSIDLCQKATLEFFRLSFSLFIVEATETSVVAGHASLVAVSALSALAAHVATKRQSRCRPENSDSAVTDCTCHVAVEKKLDPYDAGPRSR